MTNLQVRQAQKEDIDTVRSILLATAKWLNEKGSTQWRGLLEGKDVHDTPKAIERGEVYLAELEGKPAGMFVLWDKQTEWDKGLWGEESTGEYYYLHRITVERSFHGKGLGKELVKAAISVAKEDGKKEVRLDCIEANKYLNQFYPSCGFEFVKTVYDHDGAAEAKDFNLYRKELRS
jgi:GNAT superfamily N-acetyltransferase